MSRARFKEENGGKPGVGFAAADYWHNITDKDTGKTFKGRGVTPEAARERAWAQVYDDAKK
jgi:hypothetical protein